MVLYKTCDLSVNPEDAYSWTATLNEPLPQR